MLLALCVTPNSAPDCLIFGWLKVRTKYIAPIHLKYKKLKKALVDVSFDTNALVDVSFDTNAKRQGLHVACTILCQRLKTRETPSNFCMAMFRNVYCILLHVL